MKTAILWDLDGTLLDTLDDLAGAVNYALRQFGYPQRTLEEVRCFVGNGARRLIERAVPDGADVDAVLETFRKYYDAHCQIKTKPYAHIPQVLAELGKKYPMAVVSNKPDSAVKALCADYFPGLYALGESAGCPRKPAPHMILKALEAIGADRCIYVGDSEVDVLTAKNAEVPCVSVLWGFRDLQQIAQAGGVCFCRCPEELIIKIEEQMNGK